MTHIFCKGNWVELLEQDGWFWCSGCGRNIWRTDQTFALEGSGVPSKHGSEEDISPQVVGEADLGEARVFPAGAAEGGRV